MHPMETVNLLIPVKMGQRGTLQALAKNQGGLKDILKDIWRYSFFGGNRLMVSLGDG